MCGIVGIIGSDRHAQIAREDVIRMMDAISHRGPDESGVHVEAGIALGHRRLSIIDLASGQQPLFNEDGSVVVIYNGEIYNYLELAKQLRESGHTFRTSCDTEVVVHAWEEWGEDCIQRFNGFFAFALWDRNRHSLFLARDRLGIKPLYYGELSDGRVLFGSELKALLAHPDMRRSLDPQAVEEYFAYGYIPDPNTIFRHARKLPPGHTILFEPGRSGARAKKYWDVSFVHEAEGDPRALECELLDRLREAVRIRLMSEVPLGAFLSGGVDSSAVVAMMAQLSDDPVNTCSISFGDPEYNESEFAAEVARKYGCNHFVDQVEPDDFDLIDTLARVYDEPFADSSSMPTYRVCELARKKVTVALSGDGGDENFAGYRRYRWHAYEEQVRSILPQFVRGPVFGLLGRLYPKADWAPRIFRARSTFQALARNSLQGYFHSVSVTTDELREKLYSNSFRADLGDYNAVNVLEKHARNAPTDHPLSRVQYLDLKTYLPADILTKVDRASMAHSLEVRVPILPVRGL